MVPEDIQEAIVVSSHSHSQSRRPTKYVKALGWLSNYITTIKPTTSHTYHINDYIAYFYLSNTYQFYLSYFLALQDPKFFHEASQHAEWIEAMQEEINALEEN